MAMQLQLHLQIAIVQIGKLEVKHRLEYTLPGSWETENISNSDEQGILRIA